MADQAPVLPSTPGVICRHARPADYAGILALSGHHYGDRDIIPAMYFKYLDNKNRISFVAEHNGKILFSDAAMEFTLLSHPNIQKNRGGSINVQFSLKRIAEKKGKELLRRKILQVALGESLSHIVDSVMNFDVSALGEVCMAADKENLQRILSDENVKANLFPEGYITRENESFEAIEQNVELIFSENTYECFVTRSVEGVINSISFGTPIECRSGLRYNIDYQGVADFDIVKSHVVKHLQKVPKYWIHKDIMVHLFIPSDLCSEKQLTDLSKFFADSLQLDNKKYPVLEQLHMEVYGFNLNEIKGKLYGEISKL